MPITSAEASQLAADIECAPFAASESAQRCSAIGRVWARPSQLPPEGDWRVWLLLAGRGFGKTRSGAEWVRGLAESGAARRIALVAPTARDARLVMVEGESGLLAIAPAEARPTFEPSKRRLTWPNGAIATTVLGRRAGSAARPAIRRRVVRRARGVALSGGLGHADDGAAPGRKSARRGDDDAEADEADPRAARRARLRRDARRAHARTRDNLAPAFLAAILKQL